MGDPICIMVDEPTEGLAPLRGRARARSCSSRSPRRGVAILLIEQKLTIALAISQRAVRDGTGAHRVRRHAREDLRDNDAVRKEWLEV